MKVDSFAYWLQGLFELHPEIVKTGLSPAQTAIVRDHLALVFAHDIDMRLEPDPAKRAALQDLHDRGVTVGDPTSDACGAGGSAPASDAHRVMVVNMTRDKKTGETVPSPGEPTPLSPGTPVPPPVPAKRRRRPDEGGDFGRHVVYLC